MWVIAHDLGRCGEAKQGFLVHPIPARLKPSVVITADFLRHRLQCPKALGRIPLEGRPSAETEESRARNCWDAKKRTDMRAFEEPIALRTSSHRSHPRSSYFNALWTSELFLEK